MSPEPKKKTDPIEARRQKLAARLLEKRMREAADAQERLEQAMEMSRSVDVHDLDLTDEDLEIDDADLYDLDLDALDLEDDESFDRAPAKVKASGSGKEADEASYGPDDFGRSRSLGEGPGAGGPSMAGDPLTEAMGQLKGWLKRRPASSAEARAVQRAAGELIGALERATAGDDSEATRLAALLAGAGAALGCLLVDRAQGERP